MNVGGVRDIGPRAQIAWTEAMMADLARQWGEGLSSAEIAARLTRSYGARVSKNAVTCKAHRLGLSSRPSPIRHRPRHLLPPGDARGPEVPARGPRQTPGQRQGLSRLETVPSTKVGSDRFLGVSSLASAPVVAVNGGAGVPFGELRHDACRWPLWGDERPAEFKFCGCAVVPGRPYCAGHDARGHAKPKASKPESETQPAL
ncbi:MAG: hypothetical protein ING19_20730 [Azospirillum sp.]|nr:hypothetical protein [Azospirillum sp.]MCA3268477.1 hypothetical protein [Azospirillum sp.]